MITATPLPQRLEDLGVILHLPDAWLAERPQLFSTAVVTLAPAQLTAMQSLIHAIETVIALPAYQQHVLSWASATAIKDPKALGVFFGYDFHLTPQGPKLIEINTNAGGAGFVALLEMALSEGNLAAVDKSLTSPSFIPSPAHRMLAFDAKMESFFSMFLKEWRRAAGNAPLTRIAIVDQEPLQQYYYPEFVLFQTLFKSRGIDAVITDPAALTFEQGNLRHKGLKIDLVYNRLTDFSLSAPGHVALSQAYAEGAVVLTPHPHAHALYADKRNLTVLSNAELLHSWNVNPAVIACLQAGVPHTFRVDPQAADSLWAARKGLFFKPVAGFAGKGAYRGQSITHRVFAEILAGDYIAQELVAPSEQILQLEEGELPFKLDIRNYVYQGQVLNVAARLYRGQMTNFRTPGGGFAAVQMR